MRLLLPVFGLMLINCAILPADDEPKQTDVPEAIGNLLQDRKFAEAAKALDDAAAKKGAQQSY